MIYLSSIFLIDLVLLKDPLFFGFLTGHTAQRALQQLDTPACQNCSQPGVLSMESTSEMNDKGLVSETASKTRVKLDIVSAGNEMTAAAAAVAAAEIVSPEEALPEEMIPDQESPAFHPAVIRTEAQQQQSSPVPENVPQQEEHAQQQESLKMDEQQKLKLTIPAQIPAFIPNEGVSAGHSSANKNQAENISRTLLNLETNKLAVAPVHSNTRGPAKIASLREPVRMNSVSKDVVEVHQQPKVVVVEEENLPVPTHSLYQPGHYLTPKDVCPKQGEGMKLMILVTTAPGHAAQREAVRSTWGHVAFRRDVGMAFMVGTSKNQSENLLVKQENLIYGDIIQVIMTK